MTLVLLADLQRRLEVLHAVAGLLSEGRLCDDVGEIVVDELAAALPHLRVCLELDDGIAFGPALGEAPPRTRTEFVLRAWGAQIGRLWVETDGIRGIAADDAAVLEIVAAQIAMAVSGQRTGLELAGGPSAV